MSKLQEQFPLARTCVVGPWEVDHELSRVLHCPDVRDLVQVQHLGRDEQFLRPEY